MGYKNIFNLRTKTELNKLIKTRKPLGLYYYYDPVSKIYHAVDNEAGDPWLEEFKSLQDTKDWLNGFKELEDIRKK